MALTSFCGLVTLQVGATVLGAVFFTLASVILAANIFEFSYDNSYYNNETINGQRTRSKDASEEENESLPSSIIIVILFVLGLLIGGLLSFFSSYNESRSLALFALMIIIVLLVFWIGMCIFSFLSYPDYLNYLCVDKRCPESFWIANLRYRNPNWKPEEEPKDGKNTKSPKHRNKRANFMFDEWVKEDWYSLPKNTGSKNYENHTALHENENKFYNDTNWMHTKSEDMIRHDYYLLKKNSTESEKESRYMFGRPFFGAVLLFVFNLLFLIFSALTMWSWSQDLDWADYYYEEGPVYREYY